jgi:hypothetical protein
MRAWSFARRSVMDVGGGIGTGSDAAVG